METYHIYKGSIYDKNGRLIGKHTENTVFTEYGAWEMHETDGNYYLRAVGASINGVLVGQDIRGNLIAIGTNAFLTADKENQILRCYDFRGNLIWFTGYQGSIGDPPLIINNVLLTGLAAYDLATREEIAGHSGMSFPHFVFEGKLYRYQRTYSHQDSYVHQINPRTNGIIRSFTIRPGLYSWFGNIHYGYASTPAGPIGGFTVRKYDLETGEMLFSLGLPQGHLGSVHILGDNIYIHNQTTNEWLKVVQVGDTWRLEPTSEQRVYEKSYLVSQTLTETFTAHIEEEAPQNPIGMIRPSQITIRDEEIETGYEFTASYRYPLNQDVELIAEDITVIAAYVNDKSINFNQEGTKLTLSADDINAALSEVENPIYYRRGNKLIEKRNITVTLKTNKQTTIVTVIQERVVSGNIEQDVEEGNIIYDPERDEPLYPDDPDYEEKKPQYPPVPGEEPLRFGDDGYPYDEDKGPIWSNHPDHPAFGIESISIIPQEAEIFPNQEESFNIEIEYKEGITQSKSLEEILNINYSEDSLNIEVSSNQAEIKVVGTKLTNKAYIEVAIKGKFYGDRKRKMTARAEIKVVSPIESITITPDQAEILHEQTQDFEVVVNWKEGAEQQDVSEYITFTWPNLLEGEQSGDRLTITGTRPIKNAKITASLSHELLGKHSAEAKLTVNPLIQSIKITPSSINLTKGQRYTFNIEITWTEGAQEKDIEEICIASADSAVMIEEITNEKIEIIAQKIALNARLKVSVKHEYLFPSANLSSTAYIKITSFRELIPDFQPLSALRLRFWAGSNNYEMGNYLIDRISYRERDTVAHIEARNRIGHYLKDQHVGQNRYFIGPGSQVLKNILEAAGVQAYVVQEGFTDEVHLELSAKDTFLDAIGQVLELKPDWVIRQHRHDGIYPGNYEAILIGDANFMDYYEISRGVYVFRRDRDIFSREVVKSIDDVYSRVCVHDKDFNIELYAYVENDLALTSYKTFFYEVPEGTTVEQAQEILNRLVNMLKNAGKIETFVTAFRPQIEPGDLAYIRSQDNEKVEEVGIITSVSHNFGRHGFFSEFTMDSSGLVEKETLQKLTMRRIKQEPAIRVRPERHKITILGSNTEI